MAKAKKIVYWISTLWLALGMVSTGIPQLLMLPQENQISPPGVFGMNHLGYPAYLLILIGISKILGSIAVLVPRFPVLKEWAYAGFFFLMTGALYSHLSVGDYTFMSLFPSFLLLLITITSYFTRPESRRIVAENV
jgi:uncharacterized membrane protein YphA (DoxX/SURF4 family)